VLTTCVYEYIGVSDLADGCCRVTCEYYPASFRLADPLVISRYDVGGDTGAAAQSM
jgi:hypothetical protein